MSSEKEKKRAIFIMGKDSSKGKERGGKGGKVYGIKREGNSGHPLERRGDEKGVPLVRKGKGRDEGYH